MFQKRIFSSILLLFVLLGTGCASLPGSAPKVDAVPLGNKVSLNNEAKVKAGLNRSYSKWKGTPYQYGGLSKQGVDCSGFVMQAYKSELGYQLPRTTAQMVNTGREVSRSELRPGDLVFFKTGIKVRHVGIYMGDNRFVHASKSKGVIISRLDNVYWTDAYWHGRRM